MKTKINNVSFDLLLEKLGKLEEQVDLLKNELKNVGVICNTLCEKKNDSKSEIKTDDQ
tara:strand:+ start:958 stop:1131 length:174 start_codon:yes stop_codon:yes gene_type:complete